MEVVCINDDYNEDEGNIAVGPGRREGKSRWGELALERGSPSPANILFSVVHYVQCGLIYWFLLQQIYYSVLYTYIEYDAIYWFSPPKKYII